MVVFQTLSLALIAGVSQVPGVNQVSEAALALERAKQRLATATSVSGTMVHTISAAAYGVGYEQFRLARKGTKPTLHKMGGIQHLFFDGDYQYAVSDAQKSYSVRHMSSAGIPFISGLDAFYGNAFPGAKFGDRKSVMLQKIGDVPVVTEMLEMPSRVRACHYSVVTGDPIGYDDYDAAGSVSARVRFKDLVFNAPGASSQAEFLASGEYKETVLANPSLIGEGAALPSMSNEKDQRALKKVTSGAPFTLIAFVRPTDGGSIERIRQLNDLRKKTTSGLGIVIIADPAELRRTMRDRLSLAFAPDSAFGSASLAAKCNVAAYPTLLLVNDSDRVLYRQEEGTLGPLMAQLRSRGLSIGP